MAMRKIIKIDEDKCTGCGICADACAEGAIKIEGGKARVVSDSFCDGLGACIGTCPEGALTIEEREAEEFDLEAAKKDATMEAKRQKAFIPCDASMSLERPAKAPHTDPHTGPGLGGDRGPAQADASNRLEGPAAGPRLGEPSEGSCLSNWPVQIRLVRPTAPYLKEGRLLIAGDCTGFACPEIHERFLKDRTLLVGCPKLDDREDIIARLSTILEENDIKDITVLHMTVPCCANLAKLVKEAVRRSGKYLQVESCAVEPRGRIREA